MSAVLPGRASKTPVLGPRLAAALSARFGELIVDEAQDCNPRPATSTLSGGCGKRGWTSKSFAIPTMSIFAFRGGVTEQLVAFSETFRPEDRLTLSGNFRSSGHICKAIVMLRNKDSRAAVDQALGPYRDEPAKVHILAYPGKGVPATIGPKFQELASV